MLTCVKLGAAAVLRSLEFENVTFFSGLSPEG